MPEKMELHFQGFDIITFLRPFDSLEIWITCKNVKKKQSVQTLLCKSSDAFFFLKVVENASWGRKNRTQVYNIVSYNHTYNNKYLPDQTITIYLFNKHAKYIMNDKQKAIWYTLPTWGCTAFSFLLHCIFFFSFLFSPFKVLASPRPRAGGLRHPPDPRPWVLLHPYTFDRCTQMQCNQRKTHVGKLYQQFFWRL